MAQRTPWAFDFADDVFVAGLGNWAYGSLKCFARKIAARSSLTLRDAINLKLEGSRHHKARRDAILKDGRATSLVSFHSIFSIVQTQKNRRAICRAVRTRWSTCLFQ
ncbi:hypothetical protein ACVWW4_008993 [Bradyrhizobium sp. LB7.1]